MAFDPIAVRRLEELAFNAWPALRTVLVGGWVVRLAEGHERRANGASPIHPPFLPADLLIDVVDDLFARASIEPVYRLTGLQQPDFERALRSRGYADSESLVVLRSERLESMDPDAGVAIADCVDDRWMRDALAAHGWDMQLEPGLRRVFQDIVWPCGFATIREQGRDLAWGLAVLEADHVGLFDLVVAPERRHSGYGRRLVRSLLRWGRRRGARRAYLQVSSENAAALALYRSLDFEEVYGCRYFSRPPPEPPSAAT